MLKLLKIAIFVLTFLYIIIGCKQFNDFPIEPHISFISFKVLRDSITNTDERGVLTFGYTDGDGDIGLSNKDTLPPYNYNLFIDYFEKKNGVFKQIYIVNGSDSLNYDTLTFNSRIPNLTPNGKYKAISGVISDTIFINNPYSNNDTIKFNVMIKDRALHNSNIISTPEIVVKKK